MLDTVVLNNAVVYTAVLYTTPVSDDALLYTDVLSYVVLPLLPWVILCQGIHFCWMLIHFDTLYNNQTGCPTVLQS